MIDLTGDDGDYIELSSLRTARTARVESSLEILETPEITLEKMQRKEDSHSEDGSTPSHLYGRWSTAPVINTPVFDEAHLSTAKSSG